MCATKMKKLLLALFLIPSLAFAAPVDNPNTSKNKAQSLSESFVDVPFAQLGSLPAQYNGTVVYCPDCGTAVVCSGGGAPALALAINGTWNCQALSNTNAGGGGPITISPLTATLDAAGHDIINIGNATVAHLTSVLETITTAVITTATITAETINNYSIIAHLEANGVLTCTVPPFSAIGDGTTDNRSGLQACINQGYGLSSYPTTAVQPTAVAKVYIPKPSVRYRISSPLRTYGAGLEIAGDGKNITKIFPDFLGSHSIIQESVNSPGKPNYSTSIVTGTGTQHSIILDNSHPSFDLDKILNQVALFSFPNTCASNTQCSAAGFYQITSGTSGDILGSYDSYPGSNGGQGWMRVSLDGSNKAVLRMNIGGSAHTFPTCTNATSTGTPYMWEWDWVAGVYYFFNGPTGGTAELCGTFSSASPPTALRTEQFLIPGGYLPYWGNQSGPAQVTNFVGKLDALRFYTNAVNTSAFTIPTTKWDTTGAHLFLVCNWDEAPTDGIQGCTTFAGSNPNYGSAGAPVYFDLYSTSTISYASGNFIHDMELCSGSNPGNREAADGLFAAGADSSKWYDLNCANGLNIGFEFYNNDFYAQTRNLHSFGGRVGAMYGSAWNQSTSFNDSFDGNTDACFIHNGGSFLDDQPKCIDRGSLRYLWLFEETSGKVVSPSPDQELTNTSMIAPILNYKSTGPISFEGGTIASQANLPFVSWNSVAASGQGYGMSFKNVGFGGFGSQSAIINFSGSGTPFTSTIFDNVSFPQNSVPISNLPQYVTLLPGTNGNSRGYTRGQVISRLDGAQVSGNISVAALATPPTPVLSVVGTAGATTYGPLQVVCHDVTGAVSQISAVSNTITTGNAATGGAGDWNNFIRLKLPSDTAGCANIDILCDSTHSLHGYLGYIPTQDPVDQTFRVNIPQYTCDTGYTLTPASGNLTVAGVTHEGGFLFANIATTLTANGDHAYCSDCTIANPCAGSGTGAIAKRLNGVNVCN